MSYLDIFQDVSVENGSTQDLKKLQTNSWNNISTALL